MHKFRYGDPNTVERFWKKVRVSHTGCWEWTAAKNKTGYGMFKSAGLPSQLVHRISYFWTHGEISEILTIDHLCFNRACVNPDHLEQISLVENCMRGGGWGAVNKRKKLCSKGHELVDGNLVESQLKCGVRECKICHNALVKKRRDDHDPNWKTTSTKTHCINGHELTDDNVMKSSIKNKERKCRACTHQRAREYDERCVNGTVIRNPTSLQSKKTHCPKGHALVEGNLVLSRLEKGQRICLTCARDRAKAHHHAKQAAKRAELENLTE